MAIRRIKLERFTVFEKLDLDLSSGINIFIGANGTGKTHLMKVAYSACDISKTKMGFAEKLIGVFLPSGRAIGRLVKRQKVLRRSSGTLLSLEFRSLTILPFLNPPRLLVQRIGAIPRLKAYISLSKRCSQTVRASGLFIHSAKSILRRFTRIF